MERGDHLHSGEELAALNIERGALKLRSSEPGSLIGSHERPRARASKHWRIASALREVESVVASDEIERFGPSFPLAPRMLFGRACVFAEITGTKSAHSLICFRIFASHASPPRSSD